MPSPFAQALQVTLENEGGIDASGFGGRGTSNFGVTQRTFDEFSKRRGVATRPVEEITLKEASDLYQSMFWREPKFDTLPESISGQVFDFGVQSGPGTATKHLQRIVGVEDDGVVGPKTQGAVRRYIRDHGADKLVNQLLNSRQQLLDRLADENPKTFGTIKKGLDNRVKKMRRRSGKNR